MCEFNLYESAPLLESHVAIRYDMRDKKDITLHAYIDEEFLMCTNCIGMMDSPLENIIRRVKASEDHNGIFFRYLTKKEIAIFNLMGI